MEIKPKSNIMLYLTSETDNFFHLSPWDVFDPEFGSDGYHYLLPKSKAHFKFISQDQELIVFVEKIDETKKEVYLSQTHWLYMKNLIKSELELDVKIIKRYPGKLTVAELVNPNQRVNKTLLKLLALAVGEKIYIRLLKN
jgi:hypothetical protein